MFTAVRNPHNNLETFMVSFAIFTCAGSENRNVSLGRIITGGSVTRVSLGSAVLHALLFSQHVQASSF